jgi:hypothetical protein
MSLLGSLIRLYLQEQVVRGTTLGRPYGRQPPKGAESGGLGGLLLHLPSHRSINRESVGTLGNNFSPCPRRIRFFDLYVIGLSESALPQSFSATAR